MYQDFGAREAEETRRARFRLFIPDNSLDSAQYQRGKLPGIAKVHAIGDFQSNFGRPNWTADDQFEMVKSEYADPEDNITKGWLYELTTGPLPEGFYQYKFHITYESGAPPRIVCDPCSLYGGISDQNCGFVIGGKKIKTVALTNPLPLGDLVLYELMIDDFTETIRGNHAPLSVVQSELKHLEDLGITAIQFMPWTQWPGEAYNWGYEPQSYFSVAFRYMLSPNHPTEKLYLLKKLITDCHSKGIHVFFDAVFDHVTAEGAGRGFGYRWIWEDPDDSPYTGDFAGTGYGRDLDFHNRCVEQFIFDVCRYWIEVFAIDGIRFDYTLGFYDPEHEGDRGLPDLIKRLREWLDGRGLIHFPLILEHEWNYTAIDVVNKVGATSCWLDPFRSALRDSLSRRHITPAIMRLLDSSRDFASGRTPVTYIENHDHESFALNAGSRSEWWRTQPYAIALLTAPGAPMIHNGQEFAECYRMPEPFQEPAGVPPDSQDPALRRVVPRPLLWSQLKDGPGSMMFDLYRRMIALRRSHAGLTSPNFYPSKWNESRATFDQDGFGIDEARQVVVYHRWGNAADGKLEKFYVVLNFSERPESVEVSFPEDDGWTDLLSGWQPEVSNNRLRLEVGSNWGHVFYKKY